MPLKRKGKLVLKLLRPKKENNNYSILKCDSYKEKVEKYKRNYPVQFLAKSVANPAFGAQSKEEEKIALSVALLVNGTAGFSRNNKISVTIQHPCVLNSYASFLK